MWWNGVAVFTSEFSK